MVHDAIAFTVNWVIPERCALVTAMHGLLSLQNGVPVGYGQRDVVARSVAISFNAFQTYRGGEAAMCLKLGSACGPP